MVPAGRTGLFAEDPASVRRLAAYPYSLVAPVFLLSLALAATDAARVPATVAVGTLVASGALVLLLRRTPSSVDLAYVAMLANLADSALRGSTSITDVYDQPCKDSSIKHVEITITVVAGEDGRPSTLIGVSRDVTRRVEAEKAREGATADLREALANVRTLSGLLPICSWCGRVRNDQGYWDQIGKYLSEHTDAMVSHGMCPDCFTRYAGPELEDEDHA